MTAAGEGVLHVLLVDPSPAVRLLLGEALKAACHAHGISARVEEAADGFEALWRFPRGAYGLVVTTTPLPILSGTDLVRLLRARPEQKGLPILAVGTEPASDEAGADIIEAGATGVLPAPAGRAEFERALRNISLFGKTSP